MNTKIERDKRRLNRMNRAMLMLVIIVAVGIPELARTNCGIPTDNELF